jgi:putative molybdopterin biosynthesis protein
VRLVTFAHREQGFYVQAGNPLNVRDFDDLTRLRFVNRQRGAGTRVLLDYELGKRGIAANAVQGYEREEYTHLGVAVAIKSGVADCGMGVRSGAVALGLDFIPIGWERYDLVIPDEHAAHPVVAHVLEVLRSNAFKQVLAAQPGYGVRETGQEVAL